MPAHPRVARPRPWLVLLLLALASAAHAQSSPFLQRGAPVARDTHTAFPYEHVDPLSGNLLLVTTDLALPGNAGFDLAITRVYNSKIHPRFEDQQDTTLEERSWVGVGWRLHFGRVISPSALTPGTTQIEMSDGSRHPLQTTTAFPEGWMTREFWRYDRAAHTLKLPNGLVYTFGHVAAPNGLLTDVRYVTRIEDPYGNTLVFTYFAPPGPTDGVQTITQDLGGGETRVVTFTVDPGTRMLQTMALGTRTWTYTMVAANVTDHHWLRDVQAPGNLTRWHYEYGGALPGGELTALVAPSGGRIAFTYATQARLLNQRTVPSRVVTSRVTEGVDAPGTWTFAYGQGADANESVVTTPCAVETSRYLGVGTAGPFHAWRSGLLAERTTAAPGGSVLEQETFTWAALDPISPDVIPPVPGGSDGDLAIYVPRLVERRVTRGLQSWRTAFDFHLADGRFNDYGRPWRVRAYDESDVTHRVVETSYAYGFLQSLSYPYLLPVGTVTETRGGESAATTFGYDLPTGFVTSTTVRGVTTTFTKTPRGNLASVADAANRTTTVAYRWGVVSGIEPPAPAPTITRGVGSDSLVTSERIGPLVGGLTTTFEYDAAGRLASVTPPGGGPSRWPTNYHYDAFHSRYVRVLQGDVQGPATQRVTLTELDAFGRAIRTTHPDGVRVEVEFDACGRVVKQSLPYSGTAWQDWGSTWTYDALGRVLSARTQTAPATFSTTTWAYTGADVTVTDPLGRVTTYDVQAFGDPAAARLRAITDAAGQVTTYQYALAGQVREVRGPGTGPTPSGPVRTWSYDLTTGRLASDTQPESGTTAYGYEAGTGRLTSITQAANVPAAAITTTLTYDAAGRPTGRDVQGTTADDVAVAYDALGRVLTQQIGPTGGGVLTTWGYDETTGRLVSRQDAVDGRTFTSTYAYNAHDDLVQVGYPRVGGTGRLVSYAIAATSGRLTGVTTTANGATIPFAATFVYDGAGRLTSYQAGPVTHTVAFDQASRPTTMSAVGTGVGAAQRLDLGYTYDAASQVLAITDGRAGAGQAFTYDALGRLRTASGPYGSLTWTHDATGNRTELLRAGGPTTTYGYDAATQRLTSVGGPGAEALAYDVLGRVTSDSGGAYTYRAGGAVAALTRVGLSASYDYDSDGWRIRRTVNGATTYTVRGAGAQALSTFEVQCGATVWTRDLIYGAGRLLGAISRGATVVTVGFVDGSSPPRVEGTPVSVAVRLTTSDHSQLSCPVQVSFATVNGTALAGTDYEAATGTLEFPVGSGGPTGTILTIPVTAPFTFRTLDDALDEPDETFAVTLTVPAGVTAGLISHTVTLTDNDPPPSLSVSCPTVSEDVGLATCTVTPSGASAFPMSVTFATADGTALAAAGDYQPVSGYGLSWTPGQAHAQTVAVAITNDAWTEPAETIRGRLLNPVNATLAGTGEAALTINANDGTRVAIDPSLPSQYLADLDTGPGVEDYLLVANPTGTATTARLTYVRPNGSGATRDVAIGAWGRLSIPLASDPVIGGQGLVSAAVQSLTANVPLDVDHAQYRDGWTVGRATEGVAPASTWWFAEGSVGVFEEYLTVFNTEPVAVTVTWTGYRPDGTTVDRSEVIGAGPGRTRLRVRDWTALGLGDHGTRITATRLDTGAAAAIVVERTQEWWATARQAAASTPGVPTLSTTWHFAEGNQGAFDGYYAVLNPQASAQTVTVTYRHESGAVYTGSLAVGARSRATFLIPSWVPAGAVGLTLTAPQGFVAERALYGGTSWQLGHAGVPSPVGSTTWRFAEGATGYFDTYCLLVNLGGAATTATLTFTTTTGATVSTAVWIAAGSRATVWANAVPGLGNATFRTTVTAAQPLVVERASYWPGTAQGASAAAGEGTLLALEPATAPEALVAPGEDLGPRPYVLTPVAPADLISLARAEGRISEEEQTRVAAVAKARAAFLRQAPPGTQSGLAPPLRTGLGPTAAGAEAVDGGVAPAAVALPWHGGQLTLGRRP